MLAPVESFKVQQTWGDKELSNTVLGNSLPSSHYKTIIFQHHISQGGGPPGPC